MTRDRCDIARQHRLVHRAYCQGDMAGLRRALGEPDGFPNCRAPTEIACGDYPLEYAIYWSPYSFVADLLDLGADPNYPSDTGFPSLIAILTSRQDNRHAMLELLLDAGADVAQRGNNDHTALHEAVGLRDYRSIELLLAAGADPHAKTRIDDLMSPVDIARATKDEPALRLLAQARPPSGAA